MCNTKLHQISFDLGYLLSSHLVCCGIQKQQQIALFSKLFHASECSASVLFLFYLLMYTGPTVGAPLSSYNHVEINSR